MDLVEIFIMVSQFHRLLKLMLYKFCMSDIQGRELYFRDFVKYTFNIGLRSGAYKPISFKSGVLINTTSLCIFIPV